MNRAGIFMGSLALFLPATGAAQGAGELDHHLRFLEPFMGIQWEGGFVGEDAPDLVMSLRFDPVLAGKGVRYRREVDEVGYLGETHFYWNPSRGEVLYLALNSRGIVGEGVVSAEDGKIVLRGMDHWPEGQVESQTVLELIEEGLLRDTFSRKEGDGWVIGHVQEFSARDLGNPRGG